MLRNLFMLLPLILGAGHTLDAMAIPPIKSQKAIGEEAQRIEIEFDGPSGRAMVEGCIRCPLTLTIDAQTRFFENGMPIPRRRAESLSGNSGTIIFEDDRTIRIRW